MEGTSRAREGARQKNGRAEVGAGVRGKVMPRVEHGELSVAPASQPLDGGVKRTALETVPPQLADGADVGVVGGRRPG